MKERKMLYDIFPADERAKCPVCGKAAEMFYMQEKREYINPVTGQESITHAGCRCFDMACIDCQKARQI